MKRLLFFFFSASLWLKPLPTQAQVQEAMQLALNIQKLNQLRKILQNMYDGYQILMKGYNRVKGIAEGNFQLHDLFVDGLLQVSPTVRNYHKIGAIIASQKRLLQSAKQLVDEARGSDRFSLEELDYFSKVMERLGKASWDNLDALLMVVTARQLRMTDAERLEAIDRIYATVQDQVQFLQAFIKEAQVVAQQRARLKESNRRVQQWHGIRPE
jgi:hypothetical protein